MNKRTTKKIQPEEKLNSEQKDDGSQVSPAIANALVIGSQSPPISLDDAITQLTVKAREGNMEFWLNFIMRCLNEVEGFYEWFDKTHKSKEFSIIIKISDGFYVDLLQIKRLLIKMRGYELKDRRDAI